MHFLTLGIYVYDRIENSLRFNLNIAVITNLVIGYSETVIMSIQNGTET